MTRLALLLAILTLSPQPADRDVGFVVCVSGQWELALAEGTTATVAPGRIVRSGDILHKLDRDVTKSVVVAIYATGQKQAFTATTTMALQPGTSAAGRLLRLIQQRFETGFISASVRGGDAFEDAVVLRKDDRTDLASVFGSADAGSYQVAAYPNHAGHPSSQPAIRGRVQWDGAAATFPALPPGLYELSITGAGPGSAGTAWVFVATPVRYPEAMRTYRELRHVDAHADAAVREAGRSLGRGYMAVLDDETTAR